MRVIRILLPLLCFVLLEARKDVHWESNFDIPSGFRSYQAQNEGKRESVEDLSMGFEGFLDEGLEGDVRAPVHLHKAAAAPGSHPHHEGHHHKSQEHANHASGSHKQHHGHHKHHGHHAKGHSFLEVSSETRPVAPIDHVASQITQLEQDVQGSSFLQVEQSFGLNNGPAYKAPPAYPAPQGNRDKAMFPGTYAAPAMNPLTPAQPAKPGSELSWLLDSIDAKGYGDKEPEKVDLARAMQTIKGFLKKGQQVMESLETSSKKPEDGGTTDGFEGWPQPFWWTRPPAWLDEVPGWMQRLQLKKSTSLHRSTSFN